MADTDTLSILVATDIHLGYLEKDPIRRNDSFDTFDEICRIASERKVDFMLLGGDLFHENRPSSTTLVRTIEILRRYCLSDQPVAFQVVSDQTINFRNRFGHVNYEDANYNVGLPVFTIHGNHDDPAGVDNISAIDILSASNLVNYFGKVDLGGSGVGEITIYPILLRKGLTKIALYGLGNIRDERLNRIFQTPQGVKWIRPADRPDCPLKEWFNIFVLHQNRVKANPKNAINENFLAGFLDFVVWGHEHECLEKIEENAEMGFHIAQPGSSIATALTDGEAKPKHVLQLEIRGNQYRPTKIPLKTVRPFEFSDVVLRDVPGIDTNNQASVLNHLFNLVQGLIAKAATKSDVLPLIRVRVDYTDCTTVNPQKFGQKFVGKVANPHDILIFTKTSKRVKQREAAKDVEERELLAPEELNQQNIEALVAENNLKMEVLPVPVLGLALHDFVNKDDKQAFHTCVHNTLEETNKILLEEESGDIEQLAAAHMQELEKQAISRPDGTRPWSSTLTQASTGVAGASSSRRLMDEDDDFGEDFTSPRATKSTTTRSKADSTASVDNTRGRGRGRGRARGRGRQNLRQTTLDLSLGARSSTQRGIDSDEEDVQQTAARDDDEELEDPDSDTAARGRKRPAPKRGRGRGRGKQAKRGRRSSTKGRQNEDEDEDDAEGDERDDQDEERDGAADSPIATRSTQARRSWGSLRH